MELPMGVHAILIHGIIGADILVQLNQALHIVHFPFIRAGIPALEGRHDQLGIGADKGYGHSVHCDISAHAGVRAIIQQLLGGHAAATAILADDDGILFGFIIVFRQMQVVQNIVLSVRKAMAFSCLYLIFLIAAQIKPTNSRCGLLGRLLNSG